MNSHLIALSLNFITSPTNPTVAWYVKKTKAKLWQESFNILSKNNNFHSKNIFPLLALVWILYNLEIFPFFPSLNSSPELTVDLLEFTWIKEKANVKGHEGIGTGMRLNRMTVEIWIVSYVIGDYGFYWGNPDLEF